ncbi:hypothetical protein FACS189472_08890 [Alphaproteobacteria bacterium]|nr:hypothetical protein FACS189472_08890 [Alphaproteobacteria bacterium]
MEGTGQQQAASGGVWRSEGADAAELQGPEGSRALKENEDDIFFTSTSAAQVL